MFQMPLTCTGCNACASICSKKSIFVKPAEDGFFYPEINRESCINCDQCAKTCPLLCDQKVTNRTFSYAMKSLDDKERMDSTSGGVFSLLAEYVLDKNGIIFGAAYDVDFSVRHIAVTDKHNLTLLQGAKYVQSAIGTCFLDVKKALQSGRAVLFSGTPCQCEGLRSFLGREYDNLFLVDLVCHGVPSPKVWQAYINYRAKRENDGQRPIKINMRSKVSGWSNYGYSTEFDYGNGKISRIHNSQDLFMKAFVGNICLRNSCSNCQAKGIARCTDFTLGDYWGIWNQHPEFDDNKGTSVVFVHSQKGRDLLKQLHDKTEYIEVDIEDAYKENGSLVNSSPAHPRRDEFLAEVSAKNFETLVKKYFPQENEQKLGVAQRIKRKLKRLF